MPEALSAAEKEQAVRRLLTEGLDEQDESVVREVFADEVQLLERDTAMPADAILANMQAYYDAFPDLEHVIHDVLVDGDMVTAHYTNVGTFADPMAIEAGPMAGLEAEPTGETIEYRGVYLGRFEGGEITAWMNYSERLGLFRQLGIIPEWDELLAD